MVVLDLIIFVSEVKLISKHTKRENSSDHFLLPITLYKHGLVMEKFGLVDLEFVFEKGEMFGNSLHSPLK